MPETPLTDLPKIIWTFWGSGWSDAPIVVRKCLRTWHQHHPDWVIHELTDHNLSDFINLNEIIPDIEDKVLPYEALTDIIRIALLYKYGGVWVDSTLYCNQSLNTWLPDALRNGFFAFSNPGPDRMISSWFLSALPNNYIVEIFYHRIRSYWKDRSERDHYFWLHYLFAELYKSDAKFKQEWDKALVISAHGPHYFLPYEKTFPALLTSTIKKNIDKPESPVFKLTHKIDSSLMPHNSTVNYLLSEDKKSYSLSISSSLYSKLKSLFRLSHRNKYIDKNKPLKILVSWYGAFEGHGTIGDLLSLQTLTHYLHDLGYDIDYTSYEAFKDLKGRRVDWQQVNARDYQIFIFVCGPVMKNHPQLTLLFSKFKRAINIGVGVSLFSKDHFNYLNPFDHVFAREGMDTTFDDIAIAAPASVQVKSEEKGEMIIGISLRGLQGEYGEQNCLSELTDHTIHQAAEILSQKWNAKVVLIENHLKRSGVNPEEIDQAYASCALVITSRLHGAYMALRHEVPFIAIDQIKGGAKVYGILKGESWPHVYKIEEIKQVDQIVKVANEILSGQYTDVLIAFRNKKLEGARQSLCEIDKCIRLLLSS